jgi:cytochrome c-type biogenesis protein CcmH/NrfG
MSSSNARRVLLMLVVLVLCLSPLVLGQEADMLTVADFADAADADDAMQVMQMMPEDMLSAESEEADGFLTAGAELEAAPIFASSKKEAPVVTKKAAPLRAVPYTYYKPVTTLQTVNVPTQKVRMQPVITTKEVPVSSKKGGGYGGYVGNGLYETPLGQMPGLGYGSCSNRRHCSASPPSRCLC